MASRRAQVDLKRQEGAEQVRATQDYEDEESVVAGADDLDAIIASCEMDLYGRLEELEGAKTAAETMDLAIVHTELACLPVTPKDDVTEHWRKSIGCMVKAVTMDSKDPSLLTLAAHLRLRRGLWLRELGDAENAQDCFDEAAKQYVGVFAFAPVRQVLRFLVLALTGVPTVDVRHFMGLFENGYGAALMRSHEEAGVWDGLAEHLDRMEAGAADHPLVRAHCFAALRLACFGMAAAVAGDLPEDQGALLLHAFDVLVKLERPDEATLLGLHLLKLNEEAGGLEAVASAAGLVRDHVVQCNLDKLMDATTDGMEDELWQMATDETDEVLADMVYSPPEVLMALRDVQAAVCAQELRAGAGDAAVPRLTLAQVELEQLFAAARQRYDMSQLQAARTLAGLLSSSSSQQAAQALCQEHDGPRMLAFLCLSDNPEVSRLAARALRSFVDALKGTVTLAWMIGFGRGGQTSATGVLEAAVYLLSSEATSSARDAALALTTLSLNDKACVEAMKRLGKQLGPALLDLLLGAQDPELIDAAAGLVFHVFGVRDEAAIAHFACTTVPDMSQQDLEELQRILTERLEGWSKSQAAKRGGAAASSDVLPVVTAAVSTPVAAAPAAAAPAPPAFAEFDEDVIPDEPIPEPTKAAAPAPVIVAPSVVAPAVEAPQPPSKASPGGRKALPAMPPKKALPKPAPKPKPAAAAASVAAAAPAPPAETRRGRGYTQQIEAKFAETDVGRTLRLKEKKKPTASRATLTKSAAKAAAVARAEEAEENEEGESAGLGTLSPEAVAELERELGNGGHRADESLLTDADWAQVERLIESGAEERVVSLFKMGLALESQMAASLEVDDVGSAEELVDAAVAKYSALLLLDATCHCALRRLAAALVRKAEFREGEAADFAYERAIAAFDKDTVAWPDWAGEIHELKALVLIDRAKNRAALEDAAKGNFAVTRKLLGEAKQAAQLVPEREALERSINEVLAWCRIQTDQRKKAAAPKTPAPGKPLPPVTKALPKALPVLAKDKSAQRMSMGPVATARAPSLAPTPEKKARPVSTNGADPRKAKKEEEEEARRAEAEAAAASASKLKVKTANPKAILREGSMKGKEMSSAKLDERERLQAALEGKRPVSKVGKLQKEGGGKSLLGRKTWKERLFELSESALEYYEKSNQNESPLGSLSLYEVVSTKPCTVAGKDNCFEIVTKTRVMQIQAATAAERDEWIKAIRNNCERQGMMRTLLGFKTN